MRSGRSNPFGKNTAELPKVMVPEECFEILRARALIDAFGIDHVKRLYAQRLDVIAGNGEENGDN